MTAATSSQPPGTHRCLPDLTFASRPPQCEPLLSSFCACVRAATARNFQYPSPTIDSWLLLAYVRPLGPKSPAAWLFAWRPTSSYLRACLGNCILAGRFPAALLKSSPESDAFWSRGACACVLARARVSADWLICVCV
ncbi:hypothetical protein LY76DRAFT_599102 [Colletotrichum caudatum]|nr:hypothetical protein LY76DRAFT_599102 [Colletotrichum caudatum]